MNDRSWRWGHLALIFAVVAIALGFVLYALRPVG